MERNIRWRLLELDLSELDCYLPLLSARECLNLRFAQKPGAKNVLYVFAVRIASGSTWHCWCSGNSPLSSPVKKKKKLPRCFDQGNESHSKNVRSRYSQEILFSIVVWFPLPWLLLFSERMMNIPLSPRVAYLGAASLSSLPVCTCWRVPKNVWIWTITQKHCTAFIVWKWWEIRKYIGWSLYSQLILVKIDGEKWTVAL